MLYTNNDSRSSRNDTSSLTTVGVAVSEGDMKVSLIVFAATDSGVVAERGVLTLTKAINNAIAIDSLPFSHFDTISLL